MAKRKRMSEGKKNIIAFKKKEQKKFIRLRSLGEGYSENEIRLSISE